MQNAPTDTTQLPVPAALTTWAEARDRNSEIPAHSVVIHSRWWNEALASRGLNHRVPTDGGRRGRISRGDLFQSASTGGSSDEQILGLLWDVLAWGSGLKPRAVNMSRALDSAATDPSGLAATLRKATEKAHFDPVDAYAFLYRDQGKIPGLGPAFFTKFLYFSGAGAPDHRPVILDKRVSASLFRVGWTSMTPGGAWKPSVYGRYIDLVERWARACDVRNDVVEKWLFDGCPEYDSDRRL